MMNNLVKQFRYYINLFKQKNKFKLYYFIINNNLNVLRLKVLQFFSKQDLYLLVDSLDEKTVECIDAYSLFLYMKKKGISCKYIVLRYNPIAETLMKSEYANDIVLCSGRYLFLKECKDVLIKAKAIITSFAVHTDDNSSFFNKNSFLNYIFIQHGITFLKNMGNIYLPNDYSHILATSSFEKDIFLQNGWKNNQIISAGFPRWDLLEKKDHSPKRIFIMFTFRKTLNKEINAKYKMIAYQMNFKKSYYYKKIKSLLQNNKLNCLLVNNNIKLTISLHHALYSRRCELNIKNNQIEIVDSLNISQYVKNSDLFITDFSSLAFDFMYLDIPVIFYKLDADIDDQQYLEYESINYAKSKDKYLYNCVYEEENVVSLIENYIKNDFQLEDSKKNINKKFFEYSVRNHIRENLLNSILEL